MNILATYKFYVLVGLIIYQIIKIIIVEFITISISFISICIAPMFRRSYICYYMYLCSINISS